MVQLGRYMDHLFSSCSVRRTSQGEPRPVKWHVCNVCQHLLLRELAAFVLKSEVTPNCFLNFDLVVT